MAHTAHTDPEYIKERFDTEQEVEQKATIVAEWIKSSKHLIAFTGAGVSTSAGIPDFRGPDGVWTLKAQGKKRTGETTKTIKAIPTPTHMSLVQLEKHGFLKFLISQNCDGLHRRSGFPPNKLAELHGNSNLERCSKCGREYLRDFQATAHYLCKVHDHRTGRNCVLCGGELEDTVINFGEELPQPALKGGFTNAETSDLCIALGSSLTVKPACHMPAQVPKNPGGRLVIVNLQNTPYDSIATCRVYAKCDDFMKLVMSKLNLDVPQFILHRRMCAMIEPTPRLTISGVDMDGTPASIFPGIIVNGTDVEGEPLLYNINDGVTVADTKLFFMGHYNEPPICIQIPLTQPGKFYYDLHYNPNTGVWNVEDKKDKVEFIEIPHSPVFRSKDPQPSPKPVVQTGFSVAPREDCPHFSKHVVFGTVEKIASAFHTNTCGTCHDKSENWMCLTCGETFCSRYVNGHMSEHSKTSGHSVTTSFSDLSIWCYECDDYITHPFLSVFVKELYKAKFGESSTTDKRKK